jgi:dihydroorotase
MFELGIEGGIVVSQGSETPLNVYASAGKIDCLTQERRTCAERVDATGLLVFPGFIDSHVHLMDPGDPTREDFPSGTAAAANAGVTTVIEHTHAQPVRTGRDLAEKRAYLRERSRVDFALAAHAWPGHVSDIEDVWSAGAAFIKVFTCTTHGVPGFSAARLWELFRALRAFDGTVLIHCEDESLTAEAEETLRAAGRTDSALIPEWRSSEAELVATAVVSALASKAGARVVVAHVSHREAVDRLVRERRLGAPLRIETCPQYLTLFKDEVNTQGSLRKFTPPARARSPRDLEQMWEAVSQGLVDYIASDHAPSTRQQKTSGTIWETPFGLPGIDTTSALLLDAAGAGRVSYARVGQLYSEVPARLYRLFPRKGNLAPGADADIVLADPNECWTISDGDIRSRAGWSPYSNRTVKGKPVATYVRGQLAASEASVVAEPGAGVFVGRT